MPDPVVAARDAADAKAWFYLDHRSDIETWIALRSEARQLLDRHLMEVAVDLEELAEEFDAEPVTVELEAGSLPRVGLRRPSWRYQDVADVCVVMEWERARLLTPTNNEWPYVAVRIPPSTVEERRRSITEAMKPVRSELDGSSTRTFPFWRYVKAQGNGAVDPAALTQDLLTSFGKLWNTCAPILDALHATTARRA